MTLEEKVSLCSGYGPGSTKGVERLGVPRVNMSDGPAGPRWMNMSTYDPNTGWDMSSLASFNTSSGYTDRLVPVTNFPSLTTLGSSWDRDLLHEVGRAIGEECRHIGIGILLAPGVNIIRHPLCGRTYEYLSEDPVVAGELGASYVKGVQCTGVGATVKHFVCNNAEFERLTMDSVVEERALREIYLAVFERIVAKANPALVMESYNKVNGTSLAENRRLLTEILRDEWGYPGAVISDWWAINDRVKSFNTGLDLEMPQNPENEEALLEAVRSGKVSLERLDEAVRRILTLALNHGGLEIQEADFESHHRIARRAAAESAVLLKNDGGILPLDPDEPGTIAVIGSFAKAPRYQGWGCSIVNPRRLLIPIDEIKAAAGEVHYSDGYVDGDKTDQRFLQDACETAGRAHTVLLFVGLPEAYETETHDRVDYNMPEAHLRLIEEVSKVHDRVIVILQNGSAVAVEHWMNSVEAILEVWLGGEAGAVADLLFGKESPSGKLASTIPKRIEDAPAYLGFPGENGRHIYGEGIYVGYRYYEKRKLEPSFPFGHGLSYTRFAYSDLILGSETVMDTDTLTVTFSITNIGERSGKEVAQVYVLPPDSRLKRPLKELKGFAKVSLEPGERREVAIELNGRDFAYYDDFLCRWVVESGEYGIAVGASSADIRLETSVEMDSHQVNYIPLTGESYCYNLFANPLQLKAFKEVMVEKGIWPADVGEGFLEAIRQNFIPLYKSISRQTKGKVPREVFDGWLAVVNRRVMESMAQR